MVEWDSGMSDEDTGDNVDSQDENYLPPRHDHERTRPERVTLEFDVDELRRSHSDINDRHRNSAHARSDTLTNFVQKGGGSLKHVACSPRTMLKYSFFLDAPSHLYKRSCPSIGPSVGPVLLLKVKCTHTRHTRLLIHILAFRTLI